MQALGPMEVRIVHEFERPQVLEMSENQRRLQLEALRLQRARQPGWAARRRRVAAAWRAGVAAQIAGVRRMVASGVNGDQQPLAEECG
jgi:hypothetical protein